MISVIKKEKKNDNHCSTKKINDNHYLKKNRKDRKQKKTYMRKYIQIGKFYADGIALLLHRK